MTQFFESHETMVVTVVGVGVAVVVLFNIVIKVWPFVSKIVTMVNGFVGYDGEPGVLDRVKSLEQNSEHKLDNHDKMSSQLDRVETQVHILGDRFDRYTAESTADRKALWQIANTHHGHDKETHDDASDNT